MSPTSPRARGPLLALALLFAAFPAAAVTPNGRLQLIYMDVGQGDGSVLVTPQGQVVLIDDGPSGSGSPGQLAALGITHVDLHFASHYHADHIGNISAIVGSGVALDWGWDRAQSYTTAQYTTYVSTLGSKRRTLVKNQVLTLDSLSAHPVTIKCVDLAGAGVSVSDENAKSVVLKVSYGAFDAVFGGDLTGTSGNGGDIESVVGPEVGAVEVYKVHHHGSRYSSNNNWLNAIQPKIGVIQVGNGNSYGHPTADALGRLHAHGVRTYWNETGAGVAPDPAWDKVAGGQVIIQATWQPGAVDTVRGNGFAHTFTNSGTPSDLTPPVVSVNSPNGGEVLAAGLATPVEWSASDDLGVTSVDLDYSLDDGAHWGAIAAGQPNSGSYPWVVPNAPTPLGRVRITARDAAGNLGSDLSNTDFTIADLTAPVVEVLTPDGGESWETGGLQFVTWAAGDNVGLDSVNVDYSMHGPDGPWEVIGHGLPTEVSLAWPIPYQASDSVMVRVTAFDHASNQAADVSDALFRVVPGAPTEVSGGAAKLALLPPAPNPSTRGVTLAFALPASGFARLEILDVMGRRVWSWDADGLGAGAHRVGWNGRTGSGGVAGQGLYFVRLLSNAGVRTARMVRMP